MEMFNPILPEPSTMQIIPQVMFEMTVPGLVIQAIFDLNSNQNTKRENKKRVTWMALLPIKRRD